MTIPTLISTLEGLGGADRAVDEQIWLAVTPGASIEKWSYTHTASGRVCEVEENRIDGGKLVVIPAYTSSLDAALSLVPEGYGWNIQGNTNIFYGVVKGEYSKACKTPAIALSVAALKALAAREDSK